MASIPKDELSEEPILGGSTIRNKSRDNVTGAL
jgi:hypothetical protein